MLGNRVDHELAERRFPGFVAVRVAGSDDSGAAGEVEQGVNDPRGSQLINLLIARSRTSEAQPSLSYIPDAANNITTAVAQRHHLVFGRRGAGKTALLVEAKRRVEAEGHSSVWLNIQTYRNESVPRAFVAMARMVCDRVEAALQGQSPVPHVLVSALALRDKLNLLLAKEDATLVEAQRSLPQVQTVIRQFLEFTKTRLYIFLDDFHYFPRERQAELLDLLHGAIRDCNSWLKVAAIQHLTRWFRPSPPLGLQTGHDADVIDLDLTLQEPSQAKAFLERMLRSYALHVGVPSPTRLFSQGSLDRLVLASGAVPRDYLVLCANAIREAQRRENARLVGVQDVNKTAGQAARVKITELEDDAASIAGRSQQILRAVDIVRRFCLDEKHCTYFRVDFRDKEHLSAEYALLQEVMDLRLLHLISASLSDEHQAGRRAEVFMLDLSQFSGERLKKNLRVLDFVGGHIVVKETGTTRPVRIGDKPKKLQGLLRRGPLFALNFLTAAQAGEQLQP